MKPQFRGRFLKCAAIITSAVLIPTGSKAARYESHRSDRPNFLIIMADQHAPQFSGPYGHPLVRTPVLDRLAASGVVFENAYTTCPICVPARMSFMTGRFVSNIGIWDNGVPLPEDIPTWAHHLRKTGYNVALSGKMHFRGHDQLHGFERQLGVDMNSMNYPGPPNWMRKPVLDERRSRTGMGAGPGVNSVIESDDYCVDKAVQYLADPARQKQPWALTVGLICPHPPFKVPREYYDMYPLEKIELPRIPKGHLNRLHPSHKRHRYAYGYSHENVLPDQVIRKVRATYFGMVTYLDMLIGKMIGTLRKTGQLDNTVVVYFADHGEMLGEHGMWSKCCLLEQSVRIPMIVSYPKRLLQNHRVSRCVNTVDLTRTILDLAGANKEAIGLAGLDGRSMLPLLTEEDPQWKDEVFSEYYANHSYAPMAMLRQGRYKLIYYYNEDPELYDLQSDPGEFNSLAHEPAMQSIRRSMEKDLLQRWNPSQIESKVLTSQETRAYLEPYLFPCIAEERRKWPERFTKDLNKAPKEKLYGSQVD